MFLYQTVVTCYVDPGETAHNKHPNFFQEKNKSEKKKRLSHTTEGSEFAANRQGTDVWGRFVINRKKRGLKFQFFEPSAGNPKVEGKKQAENERRIFFSPTKYGVLNQK